MDLLKRDLAPILAESWAEIDREATRVLALQLAGRKLVDFDGPHGWEYAAINTGELSLFAKEPVQGVHAGIRTVNPLVELRVPFVLPIMELDTVPRGAQAIDLRPVVEAAEKIARAEDNAIFSGYGEAGITGILQASTHEPLSIPADPAGYPRAIVEARERLRESGIGGPYALALGLNAYKEVAQAAEDGYPIRKRIEAEIIDGPIVRALSVDGAVLLSIRGGDFVLTVGQDLSIGYAIHDKQNVELYITESFTFRILEPAAAIHLKPA